MRSRPIDGGQKLKKKGDKNGNRFVLVGKKKWVPGKFYNITKL